MSGVFNPLEDWNNFPNTSIDPILTSTLACENVEVCHRIVGSYIYINP
jgi:hypothetical protein